MTERLWHPSIPDAETCWARVQTLRSSERVVIELLAGGFTVKEIARARGTTPKTVQNLLAHVYDKFGTFGGQVSTLAFFARATEAPGFEHAEVAPVEDPLPEPTPIRGRARRFPLEPLLAAVAADWSTKERLGVPSSTLRQWRRDGGISPWYADRVTFRLGLDPAAIWSDWEPPAHQQRRAA